MQRLCFNLTFDTVTEQAVQDVWQRIADAGIAVKGLAGYRPHITLAVYEVSDIAEYETCLAAVTSMMAPFPIRLESLGIFPEAGVVFLAPRMSQVLLSLHQTLLNTLDGPGRPPVIDELLLPNRWTPHCTLAGQLAPPQLLAVIDTCQRYWAPICGQAEGIGMRLHPAPIDHCWSPFSGDWSRTSKTQAYLALTPACCSNS